MNTVLITGTSAGIGKAAAIYFASQGWNVIATMRFPEKETELTKLQNVWVVRLDVESEDSIHDAVEQGISRFGTIDAVVNNAGYAAFGIFEAAEEEQIHRQFEVNVFGTMRVTKAILPHFRKNRQGVIVNITSGGGRVALPLFSLYNASKYAINGFTESLLYELAPLNIRVKIVEPGPTRTEFLGRSLDSLQDDRMTDYSEFEQKIGSVYQNLFDLEKISPPELVAEQIYKAAIDPSSKLRYSADELLSEREKLNDNEFISKMAHMFGINIG